MELSKMRVRGPQIAYDSEKSNLARGVISKILCFQIQMIALITTRLYAFLMKTS